MKEFATSLIAKFDVRGANADTVISTLSGGNMQKVIIAREFTSDPKLLMVSQPTRGVDVGAMGSSTTRSSAPATPGQACCSSRPT